MIVEEIELDNTITIPISMTAYYLYFDPISRNPGTNC